MFSSPTHGNGVAEADLDPVYLEAQKAGEYGVECESLYANCEMDSGFLGLFSILENKIGYQWVVNIKYYTCTNIFAIKTFQY